MPKLSERDIRLLKVLLERGLVSPEGSEDLLARASPPPDGLADFLVQHGAVTDTAALAAVARHVGQAQAGEVIARVDLEDQTLRALIERGGFVDPQTMQSAQQFQQNLAELGRIRDLGSILVEGGRLPIGLAVELRRRVATFLQTCPSCGHHYILEPAPQPRRYACRHCRAEMIVPAAPPPGMPPPPPPPRGGGPSGSSSRLVVMQTMGSRAHLHGPASPMPAATPVPTPATSDPHLQTLSRSAAMSARFSHADVMAAQITAGNASEAGQQFGDYVITGELGRGGMGVVYRAMDRRTRRIVALKVLALGVEASRSQIKRFEREAAAAASLDHPGLVRVLDSGAIEGYHYMTQEFVDGRSLDVLLKGRTDARWGARVLADVAEAIDYAHRKGVLHRDLKPANILVEGRTQCPRVTDFGLAKRLDDEAGLTRTGAAIGTPFYMAPEQISGKKGDLGPSVDIYAMGVILYEILTGKRPFVADSPVELYQKIAEDEPRPPSELRPSVPPELEAICLRCLDKEPRRRFDTAGELAKELRRWLQGESIITRAPTKLGKAIRKNRRLLLTAGGAVACVVVGATLAVGLVREPKTGPGVGGKPEDVRKPGGKDDDPRRQLRERAARAALARGENELADGRAAVAEEAFSEAIAQEAGPEVSVRALLMRSRARRRLDDAAGARADLDRVLEQDADNVGGLVDRAAMRRAEGELDAARADLERAVEVSPQDEDALVALADVLMASGEAARARELLAPSAKDAPDSIRLGLARARALVAVGEHDVAIATLEVVLERAGAGIEPEHEVAALLQRAELLIARGRAGDESAALQDVKAAQAKSKDAFLANERGVDLTVDAHLLCKKVDEAIAFVDAILAERPEHVGTRRQRALLHMLHYPRKTAPAYEHMEWLKARDPSDPVALIVAGAKAVIERRYDEAIPLLDRGLARAPGNLLGLYFRCYGYLRQKNYEAVLRTTERLLGDTREAAMYAAFPVRVAEALKFRGGALASLGRDDEAEQAYMEARRLRKNDAEVYRQLAALRTKQKRYADAEKELIAATLLQPKDADSWNQLGRVRLILKKHSEAVEAFSSARKAATDNTEAANAEFGAGQAFAQLERWSDALARYDAALPLVNATSEDTILIYSLAAALGGDDQARVQRVKDRFAAKYTGKNEAAGHIMLARGFILADRLETALEAVDRAADAGLDTMQVFTDVHLQKLVDLPAFAAIRAKIEANAAAKRGGSG